MPSLSELITPRNAHVALHQLFELAKRSQQPFPWPCERQLNALTLDYLENGNATRLTDGVRYLATLLAPDAQQQLRDFLHQHALNQTEDPLFTECL